MSRENRSRAWLGSSLGPERALHAHPEVCSLLPASLPHFASASSGTDLALFLAPVFPACVLDAREQEGITPSAGRG